MVAIGNITPVVIPAPPAPSVPAAPVALPQVTAAAPAPSEQVATPQELDQKQFQAVAQQAQAVAQNIYVVSDKSFTIFKDATGQYVTRFTSLRDGKVTYIPQPQLFKLSAPAPAGQPFVKIEA